jgi:hypothetical protein
MKRQEYERTPPLKAPVLAKEAAVEEPSPLQKEQISEEVREGAEVTPPEEVPVPPEEGAEEISKEPEPIELTTPWRLSELPKDLAEEFGKGPEPVELPEDIQAAGAEEAPGVPEEEIAAEKPAEEAVPVHDLEAEEYGEKDEESKAEVTPPEEMPVPPEEGAEEISKEPEPVEPPEDIQAAGAEEAPGVPEEEIVAEEKAGHVKALEREVEGKKVTELKDGTAPSPADIFITPKKGRLKKILLYVPILFLIVVLIGITRPFVYDIYDNIKTRFLPSEPAEPVHITRVLPSFREDAFRKLFRE